MSDVALLVVSVAVGSLIAAAAVYDYRRRIATARRVSVRSHLISAVMMVLLSAVVGVWAIIDDNRVFTIPCSVIVGLVGVALLVRLTRDRIRSK
ncbi:hypothetical protein [Mycobacterium dioxanotrophicus]|uniref:hypothetical protein n=1 Tax=Mycobacterium dioxanotrophicus TaxID=482462 RepID=UPI0012F79FD1|nr:hypothetical protein [Mycobacterium dioxanotrophicus]